MGIIGDDKRPTNHPRYCLDVTLFDTGFQAQAYPIRLEFHSEHARQRFHAYCNDSDQEFFYSIEVIDLPRDIG